jgi:hypothetical protein
MEEQGVRYAKDPVVYETISVSTRLCYDESPVPLMRQIWKYDGDVETEGVL